MPNAYTRNYVLKLWKRYWIHWDDYLPQSLVIVKMNVAVKDFNIGTLKFRGDNGWSRGGKWFLSRAKIYTKSQNKYPNVSTGKQPH